MTDARRKAKIILLQQHKTFAQLAADAGLAQATIHNVLNGAAASRKSREAISNALREQIWDDVPVTRRHVEIPIETEIVFHSIQSAQKAELECADLVTRKGRTLRFERAVRATIDVSPRQSVDSKRVR
jgi:hypothetical protein